MPRQGFGFKVIFGGRAHQARTLGEAAEFVLQAREQGVSNVRAAVCTSASAQRPMTAREQQALINATMNLLGRAS